MDEKIFTKEQLEELTKISKLPEEEQKKILPNFLKKLSPEQLNYLKQTQSPQCPFCLIVENKIKTKRVYEDKEVIAVLEINPANLGHTLVFPKKHYEILSQIKDVGNLFNVSNKISSLLFSSLGAQGTNILVSNGPAAGQFTNHVVINIIPRYSKDKVSLTLDPKKTSDQDLDKILSRIKESKFYLEFQSSLEKKSEPKKMATIKNATKDERIP